MKVNDGVKERPTLEVDPATAQVVKEICKTLNDRGVTNRGKRWYKGGLHYLLTNEAYTGAAVWGRTSKGQKATDPVLSRSRLALEVAAELVGADGWPYLRAHIDLRQNDFDETGFGLFGGGSAPHANLSHDVDGLFPGILRVVWHRSHDGHCARRPRPHQDAGWQHRHRLRAGDHRSAPDRWVACAIASGRGGRTRVC